MNSYQTLNSKLNIDEPLKAIKVIDFLFFFFFFCSWINRHHSSWLLLFTFTFMHLADTFIQSDLQCIQAIHFFYQYVCSLGIEPTTFCTANAMLYHWATGTLPYLPAIALKAAAAFWPTSGLKVSTNELTSWIGCVRWGRQCWGASGKFWKPFQRHVLKCDAYSL